MITARRRAGACWSDALILNMSSRGMLVRSDNSPGRGSYLEIRRGPYVIVARVVWSGSGRFGVRTQDPVPADGLTRDPDAVAAPAMSGGGPVLDRRAASRRPDVRHETSRHKGRAMEFAAIALFCGFAAFVIGGAVVEVIAKPLGAAQAALGSK